MANEDKIKNFYIQPSNDSSQVFEMSATTDVSVSFTSSVSSFPVSDRRDSSDNVVITPKSVALSGVVTDVKQSGSLLSVGALIGAINQSAQAGELGEEEPPKIKTSQEYILDLKKLIEASTTFDIYLPTIEPLESFIITDFSINKTKLLGGDSWDITIQAQEVRQATQTASAASPAEPYKDLLAEPKNSNGNGEFTSIEEAKKACDSALAGNQICATGRDEQGAFLIKTDGLVYRGF